MHKVISLVCVFLIIYFLFNNGFILEVFDENPSNLPLNADMDWPSFSTSDVVGSMWISVVSLHDYKVYGDENRWVILRAYQQDSTGILKQNMTLPENSYVYFSHYNTMTNSYLITTQDGTQLDIYYDTSYYMRTHNVIYEANGAVLLTSGA